MVNDGELDFGVIPIENSVQGSVVETIDGLYQNRLFIEQELIFPIKHCVAALSSEIAPNAVEMVLSKDQALGQCSDYIRANFPNAKQIATTSTSQAFKKIAEEELVKAVAIGTVLAAEKYKLKVLAKNIQNKENNETKFILISKTFDVNSKGQISSFVIVPKKDRPGLLFDILKNFKENNLNLSKIESRPSKFKLGTYVFYTDINGNFKDEAVIKSIAGIKKESDVIFLGSYNQEFLKGL
jgi:prephenate dehydratase